MCTAQVRTTASVQVQKNHLTDSEKLLGQFLSPWVFWSIFAKWTLSALMELNVHTHCWCKQGNGTVLP